MIDSHAHLTLCEDDSEELIMAAGAAGVGRILTVGLDEETNSGVVELARAHAEVSAAVGRHPNSAVGFDSAAAGLIEELGADRQVAAIGETGLDFYRDGAPREDQYAAFRAQIGIARRLEKPLVIHMRDSVDEALELLAAEADGVIVILHCFSAAPERVADAAAEGWFCSFAGNVTYPKAEELREAARLVPGELLLVETDSPFLSPQPVRGKPNQPANVVATAERLAEVRGVDYAELERLLEANAARVFGW
ncbi:MAG: TatD family hydrolase [Solirubrobacterales bacterium]